MLVYQAAPCFKLWFGIDPEIDDSLFKHLYKKLSKNHQITCIDKKIGYDVMTCHYPDKQDLVIHLAALSGVRKSLNNPTEYWTNNVISTQRYICNLL